MTTDNRPFRNRKRSTKPHGSHRPGHRQGSRGARNAETDADHVLYGIHPVATAFANPLRTRHRLVATANAIRRLADSGAALDVPVEEVTSNAISRLVGEDAVHQGCVLYCDPLPDRDLSDIYQPKRLLLLDQVTDPHNVGAVMRSAAAFNIDAVVATNRHSPRETAVLAKSAAGALDVVPLLRVRNLSGAIEELNAQGFTTIGLDASAEIALEEAPIVEPFALVLGAEGKGLRQRTRETCSLLTRIDMPGRMPSLNVSNAAALALYVADRTADRS